MVTQTMTYVVGEYSSFFYTLSSTPALDFMFVPFEPMCLSTIQQAYGARTSNSA